MSNPDVSKRNSNNVKNGKVKERKVATDLTEWTGVSFRRRRVEGRDDDTVCRDSTADVIAVKGDCRFSIEVKKSVLSSIDGLLSKPHANSFTKFWHQTVYDAMLVTKATGKHTYPMLFCKPTTAGNWIVVPIDLFKARLVRRIDGKSILLKPNFPHLTFSGGYVHGVALPTGGRTGVKVVHSLKLPDPVIMREDDWFRHVCPSVMFREDMVVKTDGGEG